MRNRRNRLTQTEQLAILIHDAGVNAFTHPNNRYGEGWNVYRLAVAKELIDHGVCVRDAHDQETIKALVTACKSARAVLKDLPGSSAILATQEIDNALVAIAKEKPCPRCGGTGQCDDPQAGDSHMLTMMQCPCQNKKEKSSCDT